MTALRIFFALLLMALVPAGAAWSAELVMFDDPACVYCKRWLAEVGPGYPHSEEGQRAPLRRVYIRDQAQAGIQLEKPVNATPTFVLVDERAREVGRITGYPGADYFYPLLDDMLRKLPPPAAPAQKPALRETRLQQR
jgi:protein-disulfide isomerase